MGRNVGKGLFAKVERFILFSPNFHCKLHLIDQQVQTLEKLIAKITHLVDEAWNVGIAAYREHRRYGGY